MTILWTSKIPGFVLQFPTSITERGDRIASIVSIIGNFEWFFPEWIVVKNIKEDKIESTIELVDVDFMVKLLHDCDDGPSTCIHMDEVKQRVAAANAVLAKERWRPFPCFHGLMQPERDEPGCASFSELEVEFEDARLRITHQGRVLINVRKPAWAYRDPYPSCKPYAKTGIQSVAFDPETGILVIGLQFWATIEGCDEPLWDFHPIRLPTLRSKTSRHRDGGAP